MSRTDVCRVNAELAVSNIGKCDETNSVADLRGEGARGRHFLLLSYDILSLISQSVMKQTES